MQKRLRSISRLLTVQSGLHRLAEGRLAALVRREAALDGDRSALLAALNEHEVFHGAFIYPMAKRLRALDAAREQVARARERESRKVVQQAARKKRVERLRASVDAEWQRSEDQRALLDLIEKSAVPGKTSLG